MIGTLLFVVFVGLMLAGVPIAVALGIGGVVRDRGGQRGRAVVGPVRGAAELHASIAKYPLLALPMFVLVGSIFDRSGVARAWSTFAIACVGRGPGMLPMVAIWSRWCSAASRARAGECGRRRRRDDRGDGARRLSRRVLGQRGRRRGGDRHPDPAVDRVHRLQRDGARRVGAGAVRGRHGARACWRLALIVPAVWISRRTASAKPSASCRARRSGARSARVWGSPRRC
jgi:hypothetical protein